MTTYNVEILETLVKNFNVKASSEEEAIELVREKYNAAEDEYILDASDSIGADFNVL